MMHIRDYTHKSDVAHAEMCLPAGALDWMADREKLWNTVETVEKRKDAQLAREFQIALPRELTLKQNIELTRVSNRKLSLREWWRILRFTMTREKAASRNRIFTCCSRSGRSRRTALDKGQGMNDKAIVY